ncbi:MAG: hypothetical protein ACJAXK_002070 [Yoonia sp.]|jgi:hypothetical protein
MGSPFAFVTPYMAARLRIDKAVIKKGATGAPDLFDFQSN